MTMPRKRNHRNRNRRRRIQATAPATIELICTPEFENLEASANSDQPVTFSGVAYSGGKMNPKGFKYPVVVDLTGVSAGRGVIPFLRNHNQDRIVGHGEIQVANNAIRAFGEVSGSGADAEEVTSTARSGFPWNLSIGGRSDMKFFDKGESFQANGKTFNGPAYLSKRTTVNEVSFVPIGADQKTSAALSATGDEPMTFTQWVEACGFVEDDLTDDQKEKMQAQFEAMQGDDDPPPADPPADPPPANTDLNAADEAVAAIRREAAQEAVRVRKINKLFGEKFEDKCLEAISEGWSFERAEAEYLRCENEDLKASRPDPTPAIHIEEESKDNQVVECAMLACNGMSLETCGNHYSEEVVNKSQEKKMRNYTLHRLMHNVIVNAGMHYQAGLVDDEFIRTAFQASQKLEASGFSTVSLPGILSNVANKTMLAAYQMYPSIVPFAMAVTSAPDFKPLYRYRLEGEGILEKLGADGEIKHASLEEQDYMNRVSTYAKMLGLTRQMLINDDLNALTQVAAKLGEMSFKAHEYAAVDLIVNPPQYKGTDFYSATHGNLITDALSINGLTAAETAFGDQTDSEGYPISVMAERLLLPNALKITGSSLMTEAIVNETTAQGEPQPRNNPHSGAYEYRATAWLSNAMVANSSATAWWLLANPASLAAFEVAYLRGAQTPTIESADTDFNTLGMQWRAYFDFGFAIQDYRGVVKSSGTT